MSRREKRIVHNEALFREVNRHIAELEDRISVPGDLLPLMCECADPGCTTVTRVAPATFRAVREYAQRFIVAPGHERDEETVVERGASYLIVEKHDPS